MCVSRCPYFFLLYSLTHIPERLPQSHTLLLYTHLTPLLRHLASRLLFQSVSIYPHPPLPTHPTIRTLLHSKSLPLFLPPPLLQLSFLPPLPLPPSSFHPFLSTPSSSPSLPPLHPFPLPPLPPISWKNMSRLPRSLVSRQP